ncbi:MULTISPECIES: hypothetical protein [Cohnella]|uniref:hypothetical protein n=1 Tax=Cohnella TaxID=329857 RepID=UPI00111B07F6|nr:MULTISPECIES: hypothetical protein [Cohnella]MBN2981035.1 hypothetical protein [Cohnella algarum]
MWVYVFNPGSILGDTEEVRLTQYVASVPGQAGGFNVPVRKGHLLFLDLNGTAPRFHTFGTDGVWREARAYPVNTDYGYQVSFSRPGEGTTTVTCYRLNYFNCKTYGSAYCSMPLNGAFGSVYSLRSSVTCYTGAGTGSQVINLNEQIVFAPGYGYSRGDFNASIPNNQRFIRVWGKKVGNIYTEFVGDWYADIDYTKYPHQYSINTF